MKKTAGSLMKAFRKGNEEAFKEIYNMHHLQLFYFAWKLTGNREEAEEIVSDTFMKLWKLRARFSALEKIRSFLYITARNACIDYIRTAKKVAGDVVDYSYTFSEEDRFASELDMIEATLLKKMHEGIESLPNQCREVVKMSYMNDLKNEEIAQQLQLNVQTVKNHKTRALNRLRNVLKAIIRK